MADRADRSRVVSTLNAPTGTVTANAALVPAGTGGDIEVFPSNDTDLVIDVNGYFAAPGGRTRFRCIRRRPAACWTRAKLAMGSRSWVS